MSDKAQQNSSNQHDLAVSQLSSSANLLRRRREDQDSRSPVSQVTKSDGRFVSSHQAASLQQQPQQQPRLAEDPSLLPAALSQLEDEYCNPLAFEQEQQPFPSGRQPSRAPSAASSSAAAFPASYLDYNQQSYKPDRDLEEKVRKTCERISENVHICANEPSLALYRLTEHVRKALPPTVESRTQIQRLHQQLQGIYYDAEYGLDTVKSMERASPHLKNVQQLLKNSLFLKQQIKYEQQRSSKFHERQQQLHHHHQQQQPPPQRRVLKPL